MKRKIFFVFFLAFFLIAQTPTKETWQDYTKIIGGVEGTVADIQALYDELVELEQHKADVIDDTDRKNRLIKILDVHPDYDVNWVNARLNKLKTLRQYLENNGYVE